MLPERYFQGLDPSQKKKREKELAQRAKDIAKGKTPTFPNPTDRIVTPRKSKWTTAFHQQYGDDTPFDKALFRKRFRVPMRVLDTIYDRGLKAWATSGSRPGVNAIAWARARLYKFLLIHDHKAPLLARDPDSDQHHIAWGTRPTR